MSDPSSHPAPTAEGELNHAWLSLGSNIDARANLPAAVDSLRQHGTIVAVSRVWESDPVGFLEQPRFFNAAVKLATPCSAEQLVLEVIPRIEAALGRQRDPANRNGPRTIDIDLVLFNRDVLSIGHRRIPDPEIGDRPFLAVPLAELDPGYRLPDSGRSLSDLAAQFAQNPPGFHVAEFSLDGPVGRGDCVNWR